MIKKIVIIISIEHGTGLSGFYDLSEYGEGILTKKELIDKGYSIFDFDDEPLNENEAAYVMQHRDGMSQEDILKKMQTYSQECTESFFENGLYAETDEIGETASRLKDKFVFDSIKSLSGISTSRGNMGLILEIPKEYIDGNKKDKLFQLGHMSDVAAGAHSAEFKNVIPANFIKTAIISDSEEKFYFLDNDNYKKNEIENNYSEQINDLRTQMEWFYKGQTLLGVEDIDKECTRLGLDFNDEMKQANDRAKFKTELDEYEKLSEYEKNARWDEMTDKAGSLGLVLKDELYFSHARNQLREDMSQFHQGTSEMSIQEIDDECKALGLNFNYEMESAKNIKNIGIGIKDCMKNIAVHQTASVVNKGSNEIKSNYNELENPKEKNDDNRSFDD